MVPTTLKLGTRTSLCKKRESRFTYHLLSLSRSPPPRLWDRPLLYLKSLVVPLTPVEKAGLERTEWFNTKSRGYFLVQSTLPQGLGYSLADSPAGLLGWIYEKLVIWTDDYPWTDDEGRSYPPHSGSTHLLFIQFLPGYQFTGSPDLGPQPLSEYTTSMRNQEGRLSRNTFLSRFQQDIPTSQRSS